MENLKLSDYRGKVSKCHCTNSDPETPMPCNACFCRGYTAECLACKGSGQNIVPVAGGSGEMKSTCSVCGGKGKFGVNKPTDWDITHPADVSDSEPIEEASSVG